MMTKVKCLKRIYQKLGGQDSIDPKNATVCNVLHKIGDVIDNFTGKVEDIVEEVEDIANEVDAIAEKVEAINTYTTDEVEIGTWIDGKKIYRKVIQSTVANVQNDLNALSADRVINFFGEALSNYGNWFLIPCKNPASIDYGNADNYTIAIMQSNLAHREFQIQFGSYYDDGNAVNIIIEYTKKVV